MTQEFHESVQAIVEKQGHLQAATLLESMRIPFDDAYELIFNRKPRILNSDNLDFTGIKRIRIGDQIVVCLADVVFPEIPKE